MKRVFLTEEFARDLERMARRGNKPARAHTLITYIRVNGQAPASADPHKLKGEWLGHWECHIGFDWLLIYIIEDKRIVLRRTGTHDDLFG